MTHKKLVLVVDDEPDIQTYIATVLEDAGFETVKASDGQEALAIVGKDAPDLITLDISMPNKSGVRLYRDIKENDTYKNIPIIIITGISDDFKNFISKRKQVPPPEGYISKPVDPKDLLALVNQILA